MIELQDIHKSYSGRPALRGVSFTAPDACITGLLGPNGAGKTTCLRLISGLLPPDHGRLTIDGLPLDSRPLEARRRLGGLPDASGLYARLTAREHLLYFGRLHGLASPHLEQRTQHWLDALGLGPLAERRVGGFSRGESMKVALGRALVHDPRNIVLDEPTNGLDVGSVRALRGILLSLRGEGRCILLSSHVMQEVSAVCDRIVILAAGAVAAIGSEAELRQATGQAGLEEAWLELASRKQDAP